VAYAERRAAYAVVVVAGMVAAVRGTSGLLFLPGGGSMPGEAPKDTIAREVREELARSVTVSRRIGEATQYFYAPVDDCYFKMSAAFFVAEFSCLADGPGEHELD
jgi:8-oxo-dGTP pyrophosphatase MutT (NUDIX family)